jgi:tetratricopeptide (TPR) repeat protein
MGDLDVMAAFENYREGLTLSRRLGHRNRMLMFINNIGYTGFLAGDWDSALAELESALAEDLDWRHRIAILGNALIVHAARGESIAEGIAEMERLGADITDPEVRVAVLDPMGNAALASGRLEESRSAWQDIVKLDRSQAPEFLYRAARPALWARDLAAARNDLAALDATGVHGPVVETRRATLRAGIAALEGRTGDALALYREALRGWRDLRQPWDEALTVIDMATLLDPSEPDVSRATGSAREFLARVGAKPFVERLDAALARAAPTAPASTPAEGATAPESAAGLEVGQPM